MLLAEAGSTHPSLLRSAADPQDQVAWVRIHKQYDGHLGRCCAWLRLDAHATDEVCQNTWIEVVNRIQSFVYDPTKSFRGWLWNVCRIQAMKYLERKKKDPLFSLEERDGWSAASRRVSIDRDDNPEEGGLFAGGMDLDPCLEKLFREAEDIQARVRRRVEPKTWDAFQLVSIDFWTVKETAAYLGMTQASVQKANQRVRHMLQTEGRVRLGEMTTLD